MTTDRLDPIDLMAVGVDDFSQLVNQQGEQERVEVAFYLCFLLLILCIFFFHPRLFIEASASMFGIYI